MCSRDYTACSAVQMEIVQAMRLLGLRADLRLAGRRSMPAATFSEQEARIAMSGRALAILRRRLPVTAAVRRLVERMVDAAMADRERHGMERPRRAVAEDAAFRAPARRQPLAPPVVPVPVVPLVIHVQGAAAHG